MRIVKQICLAGASLMLCSSLARAAELSTDPLGFELTLTHDEVQSLANGVDAINDIVIFDDPAIGAALQAEVEIMRLADLGYGVHIDGSWWIGPAHIIRPVGAPSEPEPAPQYVPEPRCGRC